MSEPPRRVNKKLEKELASRFRQCIAKERRHVRIGQGNQDGTDIRMVGMVGELHGTVCTCCKRKEA